MSHSRRSRMSLRQNNDSLSEKVAKIIFNTLWQKYEESEYSRVCKAPARLFWHIEQGLKKRSAPGVMRNIPGPQIGTVLANVIFGEMQNFGVSKKDMLNQFIEMQEEVAELLKIKYEGNEAPVALPSRRYRPPL